MSLAIVPPARCRRPLLLALLLAHLLAASTCQRPLSQALGPSGEATLVTDLAADSPALAAVEAAIGREILTTRLEPAFELERVPGARIPEVRGFRNLIVVADLDRPSDATRVAVEILGPDLLAEFKAARRTFATYTDIWARGQTVLVIAASGEANLATMVQAQGDRIYEAFERRVTRQILASAYLTGEQEELRRELQQRYGWSIRIPAGYRVGEDAGGRFVRFFHRESGHLLFVYWQDGVSAIKSPEECLALRARLIATHYEGDTIDSSRTRHAPVNFLGRPALKLAGVWQNARYTMGGPFRTYCFVDGDRFTMIDLAVFEPQASKVEPLRQLEAIALTYRNHRR